MKPVKLDKSISEIIVDNKDIIYPSLFYIAGLILGTLCFKTIENSAVTKLIGAIYSNEASTFLSLFLNRFSLYFTLYVLCVFLGMCLIGFPFINAIPFLIGCEIAIKISYYYVKFGIKGFGFSILMIIPQGAAVVTIIIFAITTSIKLSKSIYDIAAKGSIERIELKKYVKNYLIYASMIGLISLLNAFISFFVGALVKL
ncbi:MAG: hypothetical protein E7570_06960 [Ruminococcaceae bacterium]|nr:hypothetical protein [Oscillospiraceae bacterium]